MSREVLRQKICLKLFCQYLSTSIHLFFCIGKSSLINALRNLDDVDFVEGKAHNIYGSASTGEWQTTNVTRDYAYPVGHDLQHVRLWDIAGCGTNEHPSANYFNEKALYAFDVLILVTAHELGEYEYAVLENAQKQKIPVVIAITKVEVKVDSKIRKLYNTRNPPIKAYRQIVQETIEEARQRVSVCLQNRGLPNIPIFVVSAWKYRDFMMDREALMNSEHQVIHANQIVDTDELVSQEVSDDEVDSSILRDDDAQHQEIARAECREKNAIISFELHELLSYIADGAIDRRL